MNRKAVPTQRRERGAGQGRPGGHEAHPAPPVRRRGRVGGLRWRTPLGTFVQKYGVAALMRDLHSYGAGVDNRSSIHHWIAGRSMPHPSRAAALVALSRGKLTMEDVYRQRTEVNGGEGISTGAAARGARGPMAHGTAQGDRRH